MSETNDNFKLISEKCIYQNKIMVKVFIFSVKTYCRGLREPSPLIVDYTLVFKYGNLFFPHLMYWMVLHIVFCFLAGNLLTLLHKLGCPLCCYDMVMVSDCQICLSAYSPLKYFPFVSSLLISLVTCFKSFLVDPSTFLGHLIYTPCNHINYAK